MSCKDFIIRISSRRKLPKIALNHSSDVDVKMFWENYSYYTKEHYSVILLCHHPLQFRKILKKSVKYYIMEKGKQFKKMVSGKSHSQI